MRQKPQTDPGSQVLCSNWNTEEDEEEKIEETMKNEKIEKKKMRQTERNHFYR